VYVCRLSETCTLQQDDPLHVINPVWKGRVVVTRDGRGWKRKGWEVGVHVERWERSGEGTSIKAIWPTLVTLESNTESSGPE